MTSAPIGVALHHWSFRHPVTSEPRWGGRVDRWYQLDAAAYGLAESYDRLRGPLGPAPGLLILASPGASNETDVEFAKAGAQSPARFVHSLPSVRSSAFCQVSGWSGPMLCLQRDPGTVGSALVQAALWIEAFSGERSSRPVWIASVFRAARGKKNGEEAFWEVFWLVAGANGPSLALELSRGVASPDGDEYLIHLLKMNHRNGVGREARAAGLPGGYVLRPLAGNPARHPDEAERE